MIHWPKPCEDTFKQLSEVNPTLLRKWCLSGQLSPANLSYALEYLGMVGYVFVPVLMLLHPSPVVREGAVYGIEVGGKLTRFLLYFVSKLDSSKGVRTAAKEALE